MKKCLLSFLFFGIFSAGLSGQNKYEKGYFVDNKGNKNEGLIKNMDWNSNPKEFRFKSTETSKPEILQINSTNSFGIDNKTKYIKHKVKIDNSSTQVNYLSTTKNPEYTEEVVFLKLLIEGNIKLYEYSSSNSKLFFYQIKDGDIVPLVYKKYYIDNSKIAENNEYKNQLKEISTCGDISETGNINYKLKDLTTFFTKINSCDGGSISYQNITESQKKNLFHITVRPGVNFSSYSVQDSFPIPYYSVDFGKKTSFRLGIEAEFVLPFNNNKLAIILEPTYQYYKAENNLETGTTNKGGKIKYSSIEVPVGVRYYMFLDNKSKIYVNALCVLDGVLKQSELKYNNTFSSPDLSSSFNFAFGIGYKYANRYSIEFRANSKRDMIDEADVKSNYKNVSIVFGYTLF
jgi:hypothetical protein